MNFGNSAKAHTDEQSEMIDAGIHEIAGQIDFNPL
jgi:hypothetical protein